MRILMTADAVGGVWSYALELVAGLRKLRIETHLAVMGPEPAHEQVRDARAAGVQALHHRPCALEWMPEPWPGLEEAGEWLLGLADDVGPDVVHLNSYVHAALEWRRPVVSVGHSCVPSWWSAVKGEPAPREWDRYRAAVGGGLAAAAEVVAPTRWMLAQLALHYGFDGGRVIYNGVDVPAGPPQRQPVVMAAGRLWDEAKNVETVLRAAPGLAWPVVVAGLEAAEVDNVEGLGRIPRRELLERLSTASIFAHAARYEPFGLGPLEAAASGCALVLGDIPSLRELWDGAALFVDPDDPAALGSLCNDLIADDDRRNGLAARSRERGRSFSRSACASAYAAMYGELLDRAPAAVGDRS